MASKSLSAKEVLRDFHSGMSDGQLREKYKLSEKGLSGLFKKLQDARLITQEELSRRNAAMEPAGEIASAPHGHATDSKQDGPDERLVAAVLEDVRSGLHNNEIMRKHEMTPSNLRNILTALEQNGRLAPEEVAPRLGIKLVTCPHCSGQNPEGVGVRVCRYCGREFGGTSDQAAMSEISSPDSSPPEPPFDTSTELFQECPWEQRENYGLWNAYLQTAWKSMSTPSDFFSRLPLNGGYGNPILFSVFSTALSAPIGLFFVSLFGKTGASLSLISMLIGFFCAFIGAAIITPFGLLLWSALVHVALLVLQANKEDFQATFRIVGYSSAPHLLNAVPLVGSFVAAVYSTVLTVIGLREIHHTSTGKSIAAVAMPLCASILLLVMLYGLKR